MATLVVLAVGCFPVHMRGKAKIPVLPVQFVDGSSGEVIPRALVIHEYSIGSGVSTMLGEGPGAMSYKQILAKPFIHVSGDPLEYKQVKSTGIMWGPGWAYTGQGRSLEAVLIIAPGYHLSWRWDLWREGQPTFNLDRSSREKTLADFRLLRELLQGTEISIADREIIQGRAKRPLKIDFNSEEQEEVMDYLEEAIQELEKIDP